MNTWRSEKGVLHWNTYQPGWSEMECGRTDNHKRHHWNCEVMLYGPYTCPGHPAHKPKHAKKDQ